MKSCPCKKKNKASLMLKCINEDCSVGWWHANCAGFNKDVSNAKDQVEKLGGWTCPCCVIRKLHIPEFFVDSEDSELILKVDDKLNELQSEIEDLREIKNGLATVTKQHTEDQRLWSEVVGNTNSGYGSNTKSFVSNVAKEVLQQANKSKLDQENRENNIIIFNAKEVLEGTVEEKKKHDDDLFTSVCEHVVSERIPVSKIVRIGKFKTDENGEQTSKPRPLKVCFHNNFDKRKFYASLNKLKDAPSNLKALSIQYDLTSEERTIRKNLLNEANEKNQNENPEGFLYKVRGSPQSPKIVKIWKKSQ